VIRNYLNQIEFALRKNLLGRIRLRPDSPQVIISEGVQNEHRYYHLLLSRVFQNDSSEKITHLIDIGCRNWSYAKSLADFFPQASLIGIEVDGGRRYWNLHRRIDFAQAYVDHLVSLGREAKVWQGDFLDFSLNLKSNHLNNTQILFTCFYPFLSENPCLKWGLPLKYVHFENLILHGYHLSKKYHLKSAWLSCHQGEWEADEARCIYQKLGFLLKEIRVNSEEFSGFWPSSFDTYVFLVAGI
jgi:hypothetical protein